MGHNTQIIEKFVVIFKKGMYMQKIGVKNSVSIRSSSSNNYGGSHKAFFRKMFCVHRDTISMGYHKLKIHEIWVIF